MWVNQFWTKIVNRAQQLAILSSPISASIGCIKKKFSTNWTIPFTREQKNLGADPRAFPYSLAELSSTREIHFAHVRESITGLEMTRVTRRTRKGTRKVRRSMDVQASKRNCAIPVIISPGSVTFRCCDDVCNDAERDISARLFGVIELDETFRDQVNIRRIGGYYLWSEYFLILFPLSLSILQFLTIFLRIATRWSRNSMIMSYEDNLLPILSILLSKKQFDDISNNVETQIT